MEEFRRIVVDIKKKEKDLYHIILGKSIIGKAGAYIKETFPSKKDIKTIIITDQNVAEKHLADLTVSLDSSDIKHYEIILSPGEHNKSLKSLEVLMDRIFECSPDRNFILIALGGGVIGDLTGFAASILLRGVNFVQIPTTLLSQVDSAVGGKTGVNHQSGKNLIGSFHQPDLVISDIKFLQTLALRDFLSGYAEVLKTALIRDKEFFEYLLSNEEGILNREERVLEHIVFKSCSIKSDVVLSDEKEKNLNHRVKNSRAVLNLGHTFGHAFEAETGYSSELLHGEAVGLGLVLAYKFSAKSGLCSDEHAERIRAHLERMGLPYSMYQIRKKWDTGSLISSMYNDKKSHGGKLTFILAEDIGSVFVSNEVNEKDVSDILNSEEDSC